MEKWRSYKLSKYSNLKLNCNLDLHVTVYILEVSSLGFVSTSDLSKFCKRAGIRSVPKESLRKLGELCLRCSFFIFCNRHKLWPNNIVEPSV